MTNNERLAATDRPRPAPALPTGSVHHEDLVVHRQAEVDLAAAHRAAADLMTALGVDRTTPGTADTPARMVRAYREMLSSPRFTMTTFPNDSSHHELVLSRGIEFRSLCEHHLLPFVGVAHVGYIPEDRVLGLSKLARAVGAMATTPQVQERMTDQVADLLQEAVHPRGVGVVVEAEHWCMSLRGARVAGARTRTSALRGVLRDDDGRRAEFMALTCGDQDRSLTTLPEVRTSHER